MRIWITGKTERKMHFTEGNEGNEENRNIGKSLRMRMGEGRLES